MRYLRYLALLGVLMLPAAYSQAQVAVGVRIGGGYGYVGPAPACAYGYYSYYPYACAPYGYYGPQWFAGGVFIGAGPWYHGYWGRGYGYYGRGMVTTDAGLWLLRTRLLQTGSLRIPGRSWLWRWLCPRLSMAVAFMAAEASMEAADGGKRPRITVRIRLATASRFCLPDDPTPPHHSDVEISVLEWQTDCLSSLSRASRCIQNFGHSHVGL